MINVYFGKMNIKEQIAEMIYKTKKKSFLGEIQAGDYVFIKLEKETNPATVKRLWKIREIQNNDGEYTVYFDEICQFNPLSLPKFEALDLFVLNKNLLNQCIKTTTSLSFYRLTLVDENSFEELVKSPKTFIKYLSEDNHYRKMVRLDDKDKIDLTSTNLQFYKEDNTWLLADSTFIGEDLKENYDSSQFIIYGKHGKKTKRSVKYKMYKFLSDGDGDASLEGLWDLFCGRVKEDNETDQSASVFDGFQSWLTTKNNPDYTGKEKYDRYAIQLRKLVDFMFEHGIIPSDDLNELDVDKYHSYLSAYNSSQEAQDYDSVTLSSNAGRAALKKYINYISYLLHPTYEYKDCIKGGKNLVVYGTPGCGKSYYVDHTILGKDKVGNYVGDYEKGCVIRTTFYQDYSYTDFVGQIVPVIEYKENGQSIVTYRFVPGPFTLAFECAISHPTEKVALVIEELNRGNAPAIFGDLFQLLDRIDEENKDYPVGTSEYGITNTILIRYLKDNIHYDKQYHYSFDQDEIRIPANLSILATMNTSDQNVYTLDTAFKRRWEFYKLKNKFENHEYKDYFVPKLTDVKWEDFVNTINEHIVKDSDLLTSEDKQIGVYFVSKTMLLDPKSDYNEEEQRSIAEKFAYKVFEYLWDDVAKFSHDKWFGNIRTLDDLIEDYIDGKKVFANGLFQ